MIIDDDIIYKGTLLETQFGGGGLPFAIAAGADTYTATITGITVLATGDIFVIKFTNSNTTASSLNINSLGAVNIVKRENTPLLEGDLQGGVTCILNYDGTNLVILSNSFAVKYLPLNFLQVTSGTAFTITLLANDRIQRDLSGNNVTNTSYAEFVLPDDFVGFPPNAFSIDNRRNRAAASTVVTMGSEGVVDATFNSLDMSHPALDNTWGTVSASFGTTYAPGQRILLAVTTSTGSGGAGGAAGIGLMRIKYLSKE